MSPSPSGIPSRPWTPRCTPPPQQQQPSIPSHPHPHPPPDYHHNVYIPGTPSGFCTLRPAAQRSDLDVHNSFSTFGKKRRLQMSPQGETAIINNDLYNDWLFNNCPSGWLKRWISLYENRGRAHPVHKLMNIWFISGMKIERERGIMYGQSVLKKDNEGLMAIYLTCHCNIVSICVCFYY